MRSHLISPLALLMLTAAALPAQTGGSMRGSMRLKSDSISLRNDSTGQVLWFAAPRSRARIGVTISLAPGEHDRYGALVESVTPKGPAEQAGLRAGDIITRVDDVAIGATTNSRGVVSISVGDKVISTLSSLQVGKPATLAVRRGQLNLSLKVTPERDESTYATTMAFPSQMDAIAAERFAVMTSDSLRRRTMTGQGSFFPAIPGDSTARGVFRLRSTDGNGVTRDTTIFISGGMMGGGRAGTAGIRLALPLGGDSAFGMINEFRRRAEVQAKGGMLTELTLDSMQLSATRDLEAVETSLRMYSSFEALSRLELAPVNKELGTYFGTSEGVLVVSISPPGVLTVGNMVVPNEQRRIEGGAVAATTTPAPQRQKVVTGSRSPATISDVLSLKPGDVITAVDGRTVNTPGMLMRVLRSYQPGDDVKLSIYRQKKPLNIFSKLPHSP